MCVKFNLTVIWELFIGCGSAKCDSVILIHVLGMLWYDIFVKLSIHDLHQKIIQNYDQNEAFSLQLEPLLRRIKEFVYFDFSCGVC